MQQIEHPTKVLLKHRVRFDLSTLHCLTVERGHLRDVALAESGQLFSIRELFDSVVQNHAGPCPQFAWKPSGRIRRCLRTLWFARTEPDASRCVHRPYGRREFHAWAFGRLRAVRFRAFSFGLRLVLRFRDLAACSSLLAWRMLAAITQDVISSLAPVPAGASLLGRASVVAETPSQKLILFVLF